MRPMSGHVFVVRADLTRLACDAVLPSCDSRLNITSVWERLFPGGLPSGDHTWLRLPADRRQGTVVPMPVPETPTDGPWVVPVVAIDLPEGDTPQSVAAAVEKGIRSIAPDLARSPSGRRRARPLFGVPLSGAGDGGFGGRRGVLIDELLKRLRAVADDCDLDVALTLHDHRDFAAAQARRTADAGWDELSDDLRDLADELGRRAADGDLSLFLGAGVSMPVGLPSWEALVAALAAEAGVTFPDDEEDLLDRSLALKIVLGEARYQKKLRDLLTTNRHALSHALLAGLGVREAVTTNFDKCYENALAVIHEDRFKVLTRDLASGGMPWLLKLHGDIDKPEGLVFTSDDYRNHAQAGEAVRGVVQGLMLTSHLLFVGFGMTDMNFLNLAAAVTAARGEADEPAEQVAGTALSLTSVDVDHDLRDDLHFVAMLPGGTDADAARLLEIFLDRLSWTAARRHPLHSSFLLDWRYKDLLTTADQKLAATLADLERSAPAEARQSEAWHQVEQLLVSLGLDARP